MAHYNYTLEYRPISELVDEVLLRLKKYNSTSVIEPSVIIESAWQCTYDLGIRIFKTYEDIVKIENHRGKLPDAFYNLNYALLCGLSEVKEYPTILHHYETVPYNENERREYFEIDACGNVINCADNTPPRKVCTYCNGKQFELVQIVENVAYYYRSFVPVKLKNRNNITMLCDGCPNINEASPYEIDIRGRWVYANVESGNLYINYNGYPVDEQGNMLIPNHPVLNKYYLYATLRNLIELILLNDYSDKNISNVLTLIEMRYREAKAQAHALVNMPNFSELRNIHNINRKKLYAKYYNFFKR